MKTSVHRKDLWVMFIVVALQMIIKNWNSPPPQKKEIHTKISHCETAEHQRQREGLQSNQKQHEQWLSLGTGIWCSLLCCSNSSKHLEAFTHTCTHMHAHTHRQHAVVDEPEGKEKLPSKSVCGQKGYLVPTGPWAGCLILILAEGK